MSFTFLKQVKFVIIYTYFKYILFVKITSSSESVYGISTGFLVLGIFRLISDSRISIKLCVK